MIIQVQEQDFNLCEVIANMRSERTDIGAIVSFIGLVRDLPESGLLSMTLEHYPGMTEKSLTNIAEQALARWNLHDIAIIHRVGELKPADQIVLVAVASSHRRESTCTLFRENFEKLDRLYRKSTSVG